ncbi:MAG TPA: opioid growth factor receptor-related protein [Acidobacteriaceae bacterium]|jgi:hypothetical protein|nr:opioid growth factor receptor-related protein [Acidobacteriaceae bacterium]
MTKATADLLISFYRDGARDYSGRTHAEIVAWDDERLEGVHDFIQWLFPLPERSSVNPWAPVIEAAVVAAFNESPEMRERLLAAFDRMLRFYGLKRDTRGDTARIVRGRNFAERADKWLWPNNHNHLRITRILRSVRLLGLRAESAALFRALDRINREFPGRITESTGEFWQDAASRNN